jgi:hypothetical protein
VSIEIDNPLTGESTHTSRNRANYLCQTKQAFFTEEGKLHVFYRVKIKEESYEVNPNAIWWNGEEHPDKMHRPGEVRS